jgi:putative membrane protein
VGIQAPGAIKGVVVLDKTDKLGLFYVVSFSLILIWSGIKPFDRFTWVLEVAPAVMGLIVLACTYKSFRFTTLAYRLMWIHAIILVVGGHYTYARVPPFDWLKEALDLQRNNYDKVGHLAQGFIPAIIARELLLRKKVVVGRPAWLNFIVVSICLAISALYELIEWLAAVMSGEAAGEFLGTQGYVWDTQSDMALALVGAVASLLFLSKRHDRQLAALPGAPGESKETQQGAVR